MYGNLKGWIIAGVMFLMAAVLLVLWARIPPISAPSGKFKLTEAIALPKDPKQFLPPMGDACNAAEKYRQAIAEYNENKDLYSPGGKYGKNPAQLADANPKGIALIVEATKCSNFDLFRSKPEPVVTYGSKFPELDALNQLGTLTYQAGMVFRSKKDFKRAQEHLDAAFVLGYRLYTERVTIDEMYRGLDLMLSAAVPAAKVASDQKDEAKAQALTEFVDALKEYKTKKLEMYRAALTTILSSDVGRYGGDIHGMADGASGKVEKVWRVEAIMSLGRMKYNTTRRGDQVWARRNLKKYLDDPDPAIRLAAKLANDLTKEGYNLLGT